MSLFISLLLIELSGERSILHTLISILMETLSIQSDSPRNTVLICCDSDPTPTNIILEFIFHPTPADWRCARAAEILHNPRQDALMDKALT